MTHTMTRRKDPWWKVTLGEKSYISYIEVKYLYLRTTVLGRVFLNCAIVGLQPGC